MTDDVRPWLEHLGLAQYTEAFEDNDLDLDLASELSDADLRDLGVSSMGHRKKLLRAIAALASAADGGYRESESASGSGSGIQSMPAETDALDSRAERRQLSVLFCDLVGSTALSGELDPEDMRELMRAYQQGVTGAVVQHGGYVAKFLGDGVLAYFGWPQANEDQAERAVNAGLGAIEVVSGLRVSGVSVSARVGIATGLVVVGDLAGESDAIAGETPNLAARLQALAQPGQVVISQSTQRLVGDRFQMEDLGQTELKGFSKAVSAWAVIQARTSDTRFDAAHSGHLTPLIGRSHELALVQARWQRALDAQAQVVMLSGEAGIGKSRLLAALEASVPERTCFRIQFQCSPYHAGSAFHPIVRQLERAAGFLPGEPAPVKLEKLAALLGQDSADCAAVALIMGLEIGSRFGDLEWTPAQIKMRAIDALLSHLRALTAVRPVLITFEDLHWIDPSSQDLVHRIVTGLRDVRLLTVLTHRPEYRPPFPATGNLTTLTLTSLSLTEIQDMIRAVAGKGITAALAEKIALRSDGMPLFVEEMTKNMTEAGAVETEVPDTLQASLLSRLDRLGEAKEVAQIAAAIGRDFEFALLLRIADRGQQELIDALNRLVDSMLVFQFDVPPDARYTFKHALVQDAAYDSLLKRRRQILHLRIATVLERHFPDAVANEPEVLARHFTLAGEANKAVGYWQRAGERAAALSSGLEARNHFESALSLVERIPAGLERDAVELPLRLGQAWAIQLTKGPADPDMEFAYDRALALTSRVGEAPQRLAAMFGMWRYRFWSTGTGAATGYSDKLWSANRASEHVENRVLTNYVRSVTQMTLGDDRAAADSAGVAWDLYQSSSGIALSYRLGHNQGVSSLLILAWSLWSLGRPSQARAMAAEALTRAEAMGEPLTLAIVRAIRAAVLELLGEEDVDNVQAARGVAGEYGFSVWGAYADTCYAWIQYRSGEREQGLELMKGGIARWQEAGFKAFVTDRLALYAHMCIDSGLFKQARDILAQAESLAETTAERFWLTEIHRYQGQLAVAERGDRVAAEQCYRRAFTSAEARGAWGFGLRAAVDLGTLFEQDGRMGEAIDLLSSVHRRFAAEDRTADLSKARSLLRRWGSG